MNRKKKLLLENFKRKIPDINVGLSKSEVETRKYLNLQNKTKTKSSKSYLSIFMENIFTFFNLIWVIILIGFLAVGSFENLTFMIVVFLNTGIAIYQGCKAKKTIEKLSLINTPKVTVIRNKKEQKINSTELVIDDIIILNPGNQIPADCVVVDGLVEVNESLLTGESNPIKKSVNSNILAGSFIVSGTCYAQIDKVGKESYIQSIVQEAKKFKSPNSNLANDLKTVIQYISIILVPIAIILFLNNFVNLNSNLKQTIEQTGGALTSMIPAGMFLLVTTTLSVGVIKLAKKRTMVQDIYSIEMLARTNVLCLDKTGTITDETMQVTDFEIFDENFDFARIISSYLSSQKTHNATSRAMIDYFGSNNFLKIKNTIPFSSEKKYSCTEFEEYGTFVLGAPEFVCKNIPNVVQDSIQKHYEQGKRVLMLTHSKNEYSETEEFISSCQAVAIICIEDHIREDAIKTIEWFKNNGVEIKIISGDNPIAVSNIAKRIGIKDADKCINLEGLSIKEVEKIATKFTIFGRVTPEQKHALIKSLKNNGNIVSMTGDGVNDTLALKEADCGIAMADGSEVARSIAKIVLMDNQFSTLPDVVKEGRQVVNNIQSSSVLFLMKTFFTILTAIFCIIIQEPYPFQTKQSILLEMFVIGIPSFMLAMEPNEKQIKGDFIPQILKKSIPFALIIFLTVGISILLNKIGLIDSNDLSTISVLLLTLTGFFNLCKLCQPFTKYKALICCLSISLLLIFIFMLPGFFEIKVFNFKNGLILACLLLLTFPIYALFEKIESIITVFFKKIKLEK